MRYWHNHWLCHHSFAPFNSTSPLRHLDRNWEGKKLVGSCGTIGILGCRKTTSRCSSILVLASTGTYSTCIATQRLSESGITHLRIPIGYWIMGDIEEHEPWVSGGLVFLQRVRSLATPNIDGTHRVPSAKTIHPCLSRSDTLTAISLLFRV